MFMLQNYTTKTKSALPSANLVDLLVAAVVPRPRVALAVLVGHDRAKGVVDRLRREVLRRDEHQAVPLTNLRCSSCFIGRHEGMKQTVR